MSNTRTIAKNTGWYGVETVISFIVTIFTSIAIARALGPTKMGYMIYVMWIASIVSSLGGIGIPATTRKYMAEFLGMGDQGTARYIYIRTLFLQAGFATLATVGILVWIYLDTPKPYLVASALVALSIWPAMVNSISAQANVAAERFAANLPASVISIVAFFFAIMATVVFGWGVIGVGASLLLMRCVDFLVRLIPTLFRVLSWSTSHLHPAGLGARMMSFAGQSVASMVLAIIVWDRSEFFLLKQLCSDIRQVAYYSVAFSMAQQLLISASVFGTASSATIFAQYGRDKSRISGIAASAFRYLSISSIPLHLIASALAAPALIVLYGAQYRGAEAVVTLAPLLCLPKAFLSPAQSLLESTERQGYVIASTIVAGIADIGIAWYLIPAYGAVGACIGSGVAQMLAVGTMWALCIHLYKVEIAWLHLAKIAVISVMASLAAYFIAYRLAPFWGVLLGGAAALTITFGMMSFMQVFEPEDRDRILTLTAMLPAYLMKPVNAVLSLIMHVPFASAEEEDFGNFQSQRPREEVMRD